MAVDKLPVQMNGINRIQPTENLRKGPTGADAVQGGLDFRKALDQAQGLGSLGSLPQMPNSTASNPGALGKLKFSNHSIERMHSRGISFSPEQMQSIEGAVAKAAQKGSKDTLILTGESALIVSVKNNTVVTVMDRQAMKDNVFTNIDSTVVI